MFAHPIAARNETHPHTGFTGGPERDGLDCERTARAETGGGNQMKRLLQAMATRWLNMVDRTDAEMRLQSVAANRDASRAEASKWREEYQRLVRGRVHCFREGPLHDVVQVRVVVTDVRDWRDRRRILEHALAELQRQAGWK